MKIRYAPTPTGLSLTHCVTLRDFSLTHCVTLHDFSLTLCVTLHDYVNVAGKQFLEYADKVLEKLFG